MHACLYSHVYVCVCGLQLIVNTYDGNIAGSEIFLWFLWHNVILTEDII